MTTLGEALNGASKAVVDAVRQASIPGTETPEELPELENGKAAPPKAKRKYTKRDPTRWGKQDKAPPPEGVSPQATAPISVKFSAPDQKRVRMNIADTFGEEILMQAARFPIFAADMAGTFASKGKFQLVDYVDPKRFEAVDRTFREGVLGSLQIECTPLQAWLLTCAGVVGSALAIAGLQYTFLLKERAGRAPPGFSNAVRDATRNGSLNGSGFASPQGIGMEPLPGQPDGSSAAAS